MYASPPLPKATALPKMGIPGTNGMPVGRLLLLLSAIHSARTATAVRVNITHIAAVRRRVPGLTICVPKTETSLLDVTQTHNTGQHSVLALQDWAATAPAVTDIWV